MAYRREDKRTSYSRIIRIWMVRESILQSNRYHPSSLFHSFSEARKIRTIFLDNDDQILNDENDILTFRNVRVIFTQISKLSLEIRECNWSLEGCKVCYKACLFLKIRQNPVNRIVSLIRSKKSN